MIPRFSLYGNMDQWEGNIQEDTTGQWVRWKDIAAYILYGKEHGFSPELPTEEPEQLSLPMVDGVIRNTDPYDEEDIPPDEEDDVYELITGKKHEPLEDTDE